MFSLQLDLDRPNKVASQASDHVLRVRIQPQANSTATLPLHLAIVLDTSSSMRGEKLQQAKVACESVVNQLRPQDRLSLASFSTRVAPLLQGAQGGDTRAATAAIDRLTAEGVTRTDLALDWLRQALPAAPRIARVAILITDGHATNAQGRVLEDFNFLIEQAGQLAEAGIVLCTVGLGNAANFNTGFLVSLSDRGGGAFLYADMPANLETQLQERLAASQAIAIEAVQLRLQPLNGATLEGFCQFRPEYLPLEETVQNQVTLTNLRTDSPTDVLVQLSVPALEFGQSLGSRETLALQLSGSGFSPLSAKVSITDTNSYSTAQQVHEEVDRDRLMWEINLDSTELTRTTDPNRTGELLVNLQVNGIKSGNPHIAEKAAQQLNKLKETGQLDAHKTTGLLRDTRKLGA